MVLMEVQMEVQTVVLMVFRVGRVDVPLAYHQVAPCVDVVQHLDEEDPKREKNSISILLPISCSPLERAWGVFISPLVYKLIEDVL